MYLLLFALIFLVWLVESPWTLIISFVIFFTYLVVREKQKADKQYEHDKSIIFKTPPPQKATEVQYTLSNVVSGVDNDAFSKSMNQILEQFRHYDWLVQLSNYYDDILNTYSRHLQERDIRELNAKTRELEQQKGEFRSLNRNESLSSFSNIPWDRQAFQMLINRIEKTLTPNQYTPFHKYNCSCVYINKYYSVYLWPQVIVFLNHESKTMKTALYTDLTAELSDSTRLVKDRSKDDELAEITYLYTKKDGSRDLRYSYENNPMYYYVYTGHLTLRSNAGSITLDYSNKKYAKEAYDALAEYKKLMVQMVERNKQKETPITETQSAIRKIKQEFLVGTKVNHCVYGEGVITSFKSPNYYTIEFGIGKKVFTTSVILDNHYFTIQSELQKK